MGFVFVIFVYLLEYYKKMKDYNYKDDNRTL